MMPPIRTDENTGLKSLSTRAAKATDKIAYLETFDILSDADDITSVLMTDSGSVGQRFFACMPPEKHLKL